MARKSRLDTSKLKHMDSAMLTVELINVSRSLPGSESAQAVENALIIASSLHAGQTRANRDDLPRTPYIEHPLRNALRLIRWGAQDAELVTAALLHDVPEDCADRAVETWAHDTDPRLSDTERTHAFIRDTFGARTADAVRAVTNPPKIGGITAEERNAQYRQHVAAAIHDPDAFLVKATDFADNAASLAHNVGHVDDSFVQHRLMKYSPVLADLQAAAADHGARGQIPHNIVSNVDAMLTRTQATFSRLALSGQEYERGRAEKMGLTQTDLQCIAHTLRGSLPSSTGVVHRAVHAQVPAQTVRPRHNAEPTQGRRPGPSL